MARPDRKLLEKYNAYYKHDTEFAALGRLLQSMWRKRKRLRKEKGKLGNYLPIEYAKETKANFLTDKIRTLVQYEVYKAKSEEKLMKEPRIWNNLLSSQPLCFNLFGEMHYDLKLASQFFSRLFPTRVEIVTRILFEYSPGRRDPKYTCDRSAFDVFIEYRNFGGSKGFIGIEVKYAENLKEDRKKAMVTFKKHKDCYLKIANDSKLFPAASIYRLKEVPMQQIWRNHLLSLATLRYYQDGFFVYLFPSKNLQCQNAVYEYLKLMTTKDEEKTGFYSRHLETFINTLRQIKRANWTIELQKRYLGVE